jgi:hypothetical protein
MVDKVFSFSGGSTRIGLVVRGKLSATHRPDLMAQHADVILADGSPIGFYGEGNDGSSNGIGLGMQGVVYDYEAMRIQRPYYVQQDSAVTNRVVSTVLLIAVTPAQAKAFAASWAKMQTDPGNFNIVGGNCSTHASASFIDAGLVKNGIPGLDTPDKLYAQLVGELPAGSLESITGHIGFTADARGGYQMVVKPYIDSPAVNRPNPGSLVSLSRSSG